MAGEMNSGKKWDARFGSCNGGCARGAMRVGPAGKSHRPTYVLKFSAMATALKRAEALLIVS